jgi:ElaB/YqjD/DUF883 family membrane-anchored ribosome-binding protein
MRNEIGRKVDEFRLEAEKLIRQKRKPAKDVPARNTGSYDDINSPLAAIGEELEDTIEDLETALNQLSEMTEEKIAQHPIASVAVAFAIGVLIGRLTKSQE